MILSAESLNNYGFTPVGVDNKPCDIKDAYYAIHETGKRYKINSTARIVRYYYDLKFDGVAQKWSD